MTVVKVVSGCVLVALALALQGCGDSDTSTTPPLGCGAGYDENKTNKDTKCNRDAASCLSISTTCCSVNVKKCASQASTICGSGKYKDSEKNGNEAGTTADDKKKNCCSDVPTCGDVTCPAGYEQKTADPSTVKCSGAVSTCACCKVSTGKCANQASTICGSGKYKDSEKDGNEAGTTADDKKKNCCSDVPTCGDFTCPAGYEQKTTDQSTVKCSGAVSTCQGACCKLSEGKCLKTGEGICGDDQYKDPKKYGNDAGTTPADKKKNCCTDKATCSAFWE